MGAIALPRVLMARVPHGRLTKIVATVVVGTVIVAGSSLVPNPVTGGSSPPPSGTANLWIDQNGGTCTRSSTAVAYSDAAACTRDAAETVWQWGDTVLIKGTGGTYTGKWTIDYVSATDNGSCDPYGEWGTATTSQCVRIEPAPGETVTMNGALENHQGGLWLNGTRSGTWPTLSPTYNWVVTGFVDTEGSSGVTPDHSVINGIDASGIGSFSGDHLMIRQTDAGGRVCNSASGNQDPDTGASIDTLESKVGQTGGGADPSNVVWDGIYFHDVYRNAGGATGDCHDGAFFFSSANGFTLRNSVFSQNWVYDIQVQRISGNITGAVVIENNWFGCGVNGNNITTDPGGVNVCNGQAAIQMDAISASNWLVRYNSFRDTAMSCFDTPCTYTNVRFIGNVGGSPPGGSSQPCGDAGVTFAYNVWDAAACGATDIGSATLSSIFVNTGAGTDEYHLASGSSSPNNLVATSTGDYALTTDIDGTARPIGANRDAGSDER